MPPGATRQARARRPRRGPWQSSERRRHRAPQPPAPLSCRLRRRISTPLGSCVESHPPAAFPRCIPRTEQSQTPSPSLQPATEKPLSVDRDPHLTGGGVAGALAGTDVAGRLTRFLPVSREGTRAAALAEGSARRLTGLSVGDLMRAQRNGRSSAWGAGPGGFPTSAHSPPGARAHGPIADSPLRERRGARRSRCGAEVRIRTPRGEAPSPAAGRLRSRERARPSRLDLRRRASPGGPAHSPSPRAPPMGAGVNGEEAER